MVRGLSRALGEAAGALPGAAASLERRGSASRDTGEIDTGWEEVGATLFMVRVEEGDVTEEGVIETEEWEVGREVGCRVLVG